MILKATRWITAALLLALLPSIPGCTSRSITITSNPPGAEVFINYRPVGVTPVRVGFTHYGTYRIELRKEKFQTLVKEECINAPAYGYEPISAITDNAIPARLNDDIYLHYVLKAEGEVSERSALLERADLASKGVITRPDGSTVNIAYSAPVKTPEQIAAKEKATAAAQNKPLPPGAPPMPTNQFTIKPIDTKEPVGPTISKELNIKPTTPEKKPDTTPPVTPPVEPKKDQPVRTPKGEELIFEKPKTDEKKPDAPKTEK